MAPHLDRMRGELAELERPYFRRGRIVRLLVSLFGLSLLLAFPWTFLTTIVFESDPLFGGHADRFCPDVCDGCVGPYVREATTTPITHNDAVTDALICLDAERNRHAMNGGIWFVTMTVMYVTMPVSFVLVVVLVVFGRRRYAARRESKRRAVADAERSLEGR